MDRRVLITGITGFAGKYVAREFSSAGYEVAGFGHREQQSPEAASVGEITLVDLSDIDALQAAVDSFRPTHVVHLAAISFVAHSDVTEIYRTNVVGTRNLLVCLSKLEQRPHSVFLASSANIYGNSDVGRLSELEPPCPENDYAVSKIAMEFMARQFRSYMNITIARPFNFTGRGQDLRFLVPKIVDHFKKKKPYLELGNTDISRDFSDVRSVATMIRKLTESSEAHGQVYNICSGKAQSLRSIIDVCESITSHKIEVRVNPEFVRGNEVKTLVGDPEKLRNEIGTFKEYSLEETLGWMLA